MRHAFLVGLFCFIAAPLAHAGEAASPGTEADRVQIIEDDASGAVIFIIDGKEAARLDVNGLHVEGPVESENAIILPLINEPANGPAKPDKGAP